MYTCCTDGILVKMYGSILVQSTKITKKNMLNNQFDCRAPMAMALSIEYRKFSL